jgi:uncharacterized iron-regulated membrane protein
MSTCFEAADLVRAHRLPRPVHRRGPGLERGLVTVAATLGTLFPLVGASMVVVAMVDRHVVRRVPALRRTFGMGSREAATRR